MAVSRNTVFVKFVGSTKGLTKSLIKSELALRAIDTTLDLISSGFKESFDSVEKFNLLIASQAGILTSIKKSAPGEDIKESFQSSLRVVRDLNEFFIEINQNTLATFEQMSIVNRELLKTGVILDKNNKSQVEGFEAFVNAIAIFTAGMPDAANQFRQEANSVLTGVAGKGRDVANFLKSVFGETWDEQIEKMREQGTLLENFSEIFSGFRGDIEELTDTWQVQGTALETILRDILRRGFSDTYDELIDKAKEFNGWLTENREQLSKNINEFWEVMSIGASTVLGTIKNGFELLKLPMQAIEHLLEAIDGSKTVALLNPGFAPTGLVFNFRKLFDFQQYITPEDYEGSPLQKFLKAFGKDLDFSQRQLDGFADSLEDMLQVPIAYQHPSSKGASVFAPDIEGADATHPFEEISLILDQISDQERERERQKEEAARKEKDRLKALKEETRELMEAETLRHQNQVMRYEDMERMMDDLQIQLEEENQLYIDSANSLADTWTATVDDWIAGGVRFEDFMQNLGQDIADTFRNMVSKMIAEWLVFEALMGIISLIPGGAPIAAAIRASRSFDTGTDNVPFDMMANIHRGEIVVPEKEAAFLRSGKLALVSASDSMGNMGQTLSTMAFAIEDMASRPIQNVIDFGEAQMVQFSRQLNKSDYRRREAFI